MASVVHHHQPRRSHTNHLSSFAWDPFVKPDSDNLDLFLPSTVAVASPHGNGWAQLLASPLLDSVPSLGDALRHLDEALDAFSRNDYEACGKRVAQSVELFKEALKSLPEEGIPTIQPAEVSLSDSLSNSPMSTQHSDRLESPQYPASEPSSPPPQNGTAGSSESTALSDSAVAANDGLDSFGQSQLTDEASADHTGEYQLTASADQAGDTQLSASADKPALVNGGHDDDVRTLDPRAYRAAYCQAALLHATLSLLTDQVDAAKTAFAEVEADGSGASDRVKVNSMIKSATLSMVTEQDFSTCLFKFEAAQGLAPDCPDVYLYRGQVYLSSERLDEAIDDFNTAAKLKPEFSIAQGQRIFSLYRRALSVGNMSTAESRIDELRNLVEKYPSCTESMSLLTQALTEIGKFEEAHEILSKAINVMPNSGILYSHLCMLTYRWKQDPALAVEWLKKGAKADPKCELLFELLGQFAIERGDLAAALTHFERAVELARFNSSLANLIALREGTAAQLAMANKHDVCMSDLLAAVQSMRIAEQASFQ